MKQLLRWEKNGQSYWAYSGDLVVGFVGGYYDGSGYFYKIDAVHTKWITKGDGKTSSLKQARRSLHRAWKAWLQHAGLEPMRRE